MYKHLLLRNGTLYNAKLISTHLTYDKDKSLKVFVKSKKNHETFYKEEKLNERKITQNLI